MLLYMCICLVFEDNTEQVCPVAGCICFMHIGTKHFGIGADTHAVNDGVQNVVLVLAVAGC